MNIRNYLPTYEEAVKATVKSSFYETKHIVNGYNVSLFNYRLAQYNDFLNPLRHRDKSGFEMRGLTYVFNKDGSLYKTYRLLNKFFNINQTEESLYDKIKDYKIKSVYEKADGSIVSFIKLPNGEVVAKSKMSFESEQAINSNRIYNTNETIKNFVDNCIENDLIAVFEYVAPFNRVVLKYPKEKLILLRLRDNKTGEYLELPNDTDIEVVKEYNFNSIKEIMELCLIEENKEGYVINLIDEKGNDLFVKEKTEWYRQRHGLLTEDIYKENVIIKYILDDTIDDILSEIPEDEKKVKDNINNIIHFIREEVSEIENNIKNLASNYKNDNRDIVIKKREFALKYKKEKYFSYAISHIYNKTEPFDLAVKYIRKKTNKLEMARKYISSKRPDLLVERK
jgi:T4 RnlA family RNA ligase